MCNVTYYSCSECKELTFNKPYICSPKMCFKFIYFQRLEELCQTCFYSKHGRPDMLRFKRRGYPLRNRFISFS